MAEKKEKTDKLGRWQKILYIFIASCIILSGSYGILWATVLRPAIRNEIEKKISPVVGAVQYNSFILMELLDSSQVRRATDRFTAWKTGAGGLGK